MIKIAIDAMGGDYAPQAIVEGAIQAVNQYDDLSIDLFGDELLLKPLFANHANNQIQIIPCTELITGDDEPVRAIRQKKDASMVRAAESVKNGENDAFVSAGNTGALLTSAIFIIGRMKKIKRPGLAPILPTLNPIHTRVVLLDGGANVDLDANSIHQFAIMGAVYAEQGLGIEEPRIGLLNNGSEPGKGSKLTKEAFEMLDNDPFIRFVGNVEPNYLLDGVCDVVVTDGFAGNLTLKTFEGVFKSVLAVLKDTLTKGNLMSKVGGLMIKPALNKALQNVRANQESGAIFLGINAPVIKAHGNSNAEEILGAIELARITVKNSVIKTIEEQIARDQG